MSLTDLKRYAFAGQAFARVISQGPWQAWFVTDTIRSIEPILGSTARFTDIGGTTLASFQIRAAFESAAERQTMLGRRGSIATLTNGGGLSQTCLLATVANMGMEGPFFVADLTFEAA